MGYLRSVKGLNSQSQTGFTIVELLIVIVVIGILAALVLNSFAGIQAKGRDTQRTTDVKAVVTQLEGYFNQAGAGSYPDVATTPTATTFGQTFITANFKGLDGNALLDPTHTTGYDWTNATALTVGTAAPTTAATAPSSANLKYLYVPYNGTGAGAVLCVAQPCVHYVVFYYTENSPTVGVQSKLSLN
jgi:general secretion pathway protein G